MATVEDVERRIMEVEQFEVHFMLNGKNVRGDQTGLDEYPFSHGANKDWTVSQYKEKRFKVVYPDYDVVVRYGDGSQAPGNTKLRTVRNSTE